MEGLKAVTFDCFGTLVDWKQGQSRVLRQFPSLESTTDSDLDRVVALRGEVEIDLQTGPWTPYSEVLEGSIREAAQKALGLELTGSECRAFSAGQPGWPLFPDSSSALGRLATAGLKIGLLSNCERGILEHTARAKLELGGALCVSSEELRSYKPASAHWGAPPIPKMAQPSSRTWTATATPWETANKLRPSSGNPTGAMPSA